MSRRFPLAAITALAAHSICVSGCTGDSTNLIFSWTVHQVSTTAGTTIMEFHLDQPGLVAQIGATSILADGSGCFQFNSSQYCVPDNHTVCGLTSGHTYQMGWTCSNDPLLIEWPTGWSIQSASWHSTKAPFAGLLLNHPITDYSIPSIYGTLVTDPGYSAHVIGLDAGGFAYDSLSMHLVFTRPNGEYGFVKFMNATILSIPEAGLSEVLPVEGLGIDFTQIPTTDTAHCFYTGDLTTPALQQSWGRVKAIYR